MSKLSIIGLNHQQSGCGYHRVLIPLAFMNDIKGYVTNAITEDKMDGWDILLYNRISQYDQDWPEFRKILGCKIVLDLDDYWILPPNHMNYGQYLLFADRIENNIREADLVTTTNERLADKIRPFNSNVLVVPNALPYGRNQFHDERVKDGRIRIFWAGGITHEQDLALLRGPVQKLKIHADKIKMVLGGYNETDAYTKSIWQRMFSAFTSGGQLPYAKLHGTSVINYMQLYEHADICVIPLENSEWHACKSNLKILEAAAKKIPVIVSKVEPYSNDADAPVLWVEKQSDWFTHLNYLINNKQAREDYGQKLYEWAKTKYSIDAINNTRFDAFTSLCKSPALLGVLPTDGGASELSP